MSRLTNQEELRKIVKIALVTLRSMFIVLVLLFFWLFRWVENSQERIAIQGIMVLLLIGVVIAIRMAIKLRFRMRRTFQQLEPFKNLVINMNQGASFHEVLRYIYNTFSQFIPYDHIGIALMKDNGVTLESSFGISRDNMELAKNMYGIKAQIEKTSLGEVIRRGTPRLINDLEAYMIDSKRKNTNYNKTIREAGIQASITLPLKIDDEPIGVIFFSSTRKNVYNQSHIEFLKVISSSIALSFKHSLLFDELLYSSLLALAKLAEAKDKDTGNHIERIKDYSKKITLLLQQDGIYEDEITPEFVIDVTRFSPMHDIGKVGIPDHILLKPGRLTKEEFQIMKEHTFYGAEVLRVAENNLSKRGKSIFQCGIEIAEYHHECWDGTGYPHQKKGTEIPLSARIVAVADVFDALTSERPYKTAFSFEESFQLIMDGRGTHFDPEIVDCLARHKKEWYRLYRSLHKREFVEKYNTVLQPFKKVQ